MGWIKDAKQQNLANEALRALAEGRMIFAPMLNTPMTHHSMTGAVAGWAEMIEAIEEQGWVMYHWAIGQDDKGRPQAYPLFRRGPTHSARG